MIFDWLLLVKYRIIDLQHQLFQKATFLLLPVFRNCQPTKTPIELMACGKPFIGKNLADGLLVFSGVAFEINVDNPWLIEAPSRDVEIYLHGFSWLNDLSAYGNTKARRLALEWVGKWNYYDNHGKKIGWDPDTTALRSINFLRNLKFLKGSLNKVDQDCYKNLRRQYFFLRIISNTLGSGLTKLNVLYAVFMIAKAYNFSAQKQQKSLKKFCKVVVSHIDLDGQILTRNPEELLKCFVMINEILRTVVDETE